MKSLAVERGIRVLQPATLKDGGIPEDLKALTLDAIVTAAFGLIFPAPLLGIPRYGCINIHASLLPRWRGAAPIQRALLAGDKVTGVSIMQMDAGLDTGPVFLREEIPISEGDTAGGLGERLAGLGGQLVLRTLDALETGGIRAAPQSEEGISYAAKLEKRESRIDWRESAAAVDRRVRAFNPSPGAGTRVRGIELKVWSGGVAEAAGTPGEILWADQRGIGVACGDGAWAISELQRTGGRRLGSAEFLRGFPLARGERFEA